MNRSSPARRTVITSCLLLLVVAFLAHIAIGSSVWISPSMLVSEIWNGPQRGNPWSDIVWQIRLPRACGCVLIGAMLGAVGAAFQSLLKNPLAEPYVVGVSSGASVGGVIAFVFGFGGALAGMGSIVAASIGGIASLVLVLWIARKHGTVRVETLILSGVVVGSLLSALLTVILLGAGQDTNRVLRWLLGSMTPMYWNRLGILLFLSIFGIAILYWQARVLNAFAVSDSAARSLGVDSGKLRTTVLTTGTVMTSACVGVVGIIGFLGLVAPHLSRRLFGVDLRRSLIGSAVIGAACLLVADIIAQRAVRFYELPVGAVTALLGAPSLILLLKKTGR